MKMKRVMTLLLALVLVISLTACESSEKKKSEKKSPKKEIVGEWYNAEEEDYLIIQSDGTYKMKHHAGAMGYDIGSDHGTWKWLEDEELYKFKDANGKTHEVVIEKGIGKRIIEYYYYGSFKKQ